MNVFYSTKDLTLTWRDISYEVKKRNGENYLKVFFGNNNSEYTKVLQGGIFRIY